MNFKTFKSLAGYLDSVKCINAGGCGVSAFFIYEFFKAKGKDPKIAFWHSDWDHWKDQNEAALKGEGEPCAPGHVVVKVGDVYYDSKGAHLGTSYKESWTDEELIVDEKFLLKALKADNWNDSFDRDQELPEMEKKIGICLPTL